jgi:hypothetical protein
MSSFILITRVLYKIISINFKNKNNKNKDENYFRIRIIRIK